MEPGPLASPPAQLPPATWDSNLPESILIQLKKGVLELCVLQLLSQGDTYGYQITSRLAADIEMGEGTIYPLMKRMQNEGLVSTYLVESASGPPRKYYKLTAEGRAALTAQRAEWDAFKRAVGRVLGEEA
jgi:PadR family transcriptional regulator PadR